MRGDDSAAPVVVTVAIETLLVSPVHAYEGRPDDGPAPDPEPVSRPSVQVRAGLGLVGDRYCGRAAHRLAAVTVMSAESLDAVRDDLDLDATPGAVDARRNVVLRGFGVDTLAAVGRGGTGAVFALDSGDGPVRFRAHRPAAPCRWMDVVLAPGAFRALRGRGGVRCEPLDDGVLRLGPAVLTVLEPAVAGERLRPSGGSRGSRSPAPAR
ncbi:molybdenum cofactor biosysynthesis protein [Pseudonocardia sp. KRD291]|uniref:molybdenum cofactor biosysynthesis protein n=1 Tax=Pseudonocardia sp. KRD291 TaxID=2792007 RepID=UPI001CF7AC65|nr:molybdenum cofactor biosysynthesis protein [Pseudonocardia sp. KRD291]